MLRSIIWDVDGTLFDTYPSIARAFRGALNDLGRDAPLDRITSLARESLDHCLSVLSATCDVGLDDLEHAFGQQYASEAVGDSPPFPGTIDVCRYICAIGGSNVIATHRRRWGTMMLLDANDMAGYFAGVLTGDDGYPRKPDPAIFEGALAAFHLERGETIAVGDRDIDIAAGRAARLRTCLYAPGGDEGAADLVVRDFAELDRYLRTANSQDVIAG